MYTIQQASTRSGVGVSLIRAWERRYGVVRPQRGANGYRLYDDASIATLTRMRRLVDDGWQPSAAAAAIRDGTAPSVPPQPQATSADGGVLSDRFAKAAARYDGRAIEATLDEMQARGSFESTIDTVILPAAVVLGEQWERGDLDVAAEHTASAAIMRRLSAAFEAAGVVGGGPLVIVGMPPGARHELGALAFATALRRRGIAVLYLGPDVPIGSWVHAVIESGAAGAVLGAVRADDAHSAGQVAEAIHAAAPSVRIGVGGHAADQVAVSLPLVVLPPSVVEAAAAMADAIG